MNGLAYYNEIDPYAAQWLRNLIDTGHIAPGFVDERSIEDIGPDDLRGFTQCHFFAGIGVWSYALRRAGWPDDRPVWTGSCPCQPFSAAGKGAGFDDKRHLWPAWHHLIRECRPAVVFGEQVASKDGLAWLDLVHSDLEGAGYAVGAADLCAAGVGAPHIRQRLYFVAYSEQHGNRREAAPSDHEGPQTDGPANRLGRRSGASGALADRNAHRCGTAPGNGAARGFWADADWIACRDGKARPVEPGTFPLAHGAPARVGRLRAYGNAIVAPLAAEFIGAYINLTEAA